MLQQIFNSYSSKIDDDSNLNNKKSNYDDFLDEASALPTKQKSHELLNKYCTLYNKEQCLKPLNIQKLNKQKELDDRKNSTGPMWFNMKAPEMTPELKNELKALQLKSYIDPFNFKKKNDKAKQEKFFQIGTIQDNILDGKRNRLKKNMVKNSIVEEMLVYDLQKNFSTRKFEEYQNQRKKIGLKKTKLNKYKLKTRGKTKGVVAK